MLRRQRLTFVVDLTSGEGQESHNGGQWLKSHQNLIITGACGTGKNWLACALGHNAARGVHGSLPAAATALRRPRYRLRRRYPRLFRSLCRTGC
jgi:DNA replication protein DnaC